MFFGMFLCFIPFKLIFIYLKKSNQNQIEFNHELPSINHENTRKWSIIKLIEGNNEFNSKVFIPATILDIISTSLAYIALNLTYASSFQMFNGNFVNVFTI